MEIWAVGISHHTAPVEVREQFALPGNLAAELLRAINSERVFEEALVLDTCNRTELYLVSEGPQDCVSRLLGYFAKLKQISPPADTSVFYHHNGLAAVEHLFRVAASLDSQIVGEDQVLGQVKNAYRLAAEERSAGFALNRMLHRAMRAGKRVRTQTQLGRGAASIPQAAVELAGQIFSSLADKTALLIGAGETGELAARNLIGRGVNHIIVANRTLSRAEQVAADLLPAANDTPPPAKTGALTTRAIGLADIPSVISDVDLVISSTGSPEVVLGYDDVGKVLRKSSRPLFVVDIAVPRDVDPKLNGLSNVFLYNIDDLNSLVAANIERRRREIPRAEAIVAHEVELFAKWLDSLQVAPVVKLLQQYFDQLRQAEIQRYGRQFSDSDNDQLEVFTRSLCKKILHGPLTFLRTVSQSNSARESEAAVDIVRQMFDLDSLEENQ